MEEGTKGSAVRKWRCLDGTDVVARGDCDPGEADIGGTSIKAGLR